jgi:thioester reductase-like protein
MVKVNKIFLTGITGTLGQELVAELLRRTSYSLILLARGRKDQSAEDRVLKLLSDKELSEEQLQRIEVVSGDITAENFGLNENEIQKMTKNVDAFFHIAALTALNGSEEDCFDINVGGTKHALKLAWKFYREGKMQRFYYFSTAFVAGSRQTYCSKEDELPAEPKHANFYEASKYQSEGNVRKALSEGLPATIFRPSIVVGDSKTGKVSEFNVIYPFIRLFAHGILKTIPADLSNSFNIVPIDFVIDATIEIAFKPESRGKTYHLIGDRQPTIQDLLDISYEEYSNFPQLDVVSPQNFVRENFGEDERMIYDMLDPYLGYLNDHLTFDASNTREILAGTNILLPQVDKEFLKILIRYAVERGYLLID